MFTQNYLKNQTNLQKKKKFIHTQSPYLIKNLSSPIYNDKNLSAMEKFKISMCLDFFFANMR